MKNYPRSIKMSEALSISYYRKSLVLDLQLGDPLTDVEDVLNRRDMLFQRTEREFQIEMTDFVLSENSADLRLAIGSDNGKVVSYFYFYTSYESYKERSPFSPTLAELSLFLLREPYDPLILVKYNFDYKNDTFYSYHKLQEAWYRSYYEVFHLRRWGYDVSMSIMSIGEYERMNTPIWKTFLKRVRKI